MTKNAMTFDASVRDFILDAFDKSVDAEGFVIEKSHPDQRVITPEGEELRAEHFAGVHRGSLVFVRSGIMSAVRLADRLG